MNEPFISPWIFYFIGLAEKLSSLFCKLALACGAISFYCFIFSCLASDEKQYNSAKKYMNKAKFYIMLVMILISVSAIIPSEETSTKMLVASQITQANVDKGTETIKNTVNYVLKKIQETRK